MTEWGLQQWQLRAMSISTEAGHGWMKTGGVGWVGFWKILQASDEWTPLHSFVVGTVCVSWAVSLPCQSHNVHTVVGTKGFRVSCLAIIIQYTRLCHTITPVEICECLIQAYLTRSCMLTICSLPHEGTKWASRQPLRLFRTTRAIKADEHFTPHNMFSVCVALAFQVKPVKLSDAHTPHRFRRASTAANASYEAQVTVATLLAAS